MIRVVVTEMKMYQLSLKLSGSFRVRNPNIAESRIKRRFRISGTRRVALEALLQDSSTSRVFGIGMDKEALNGKRKTVTIAAANCKIKKREHFDKFLAFGRILE